MASEIFDSRSYDNVRRALPSAETLPAWCYTSEAFLAAELEKLFTRSWCFVARADEVAVPGDFLAVETPAGPVLIARDRDGRIRAFVNACRHRGCQIAVDRGNCRAFVCPYHGWTYGLDGALLAARHMDRTQDFDRQRYGLREIRAEAWGGFLFVSYNDGGPSLAEHLGDFPERFASYRCDELVCTKRVSYAVACNWKLLLENALEDYHTSSVHRASIGVQVAVRVPTRGHWELLVVDGTAPVGVLPGETSPFSWIDGLAGPARRCSQFTIVYPNTQFCFTQDCVWWLSTTPLAPDRTRLDVGYCFPAETARRPGFESDADAYYRRWSTTAEEDIAISERQQMGLRARLRTPGPLSWKDEVVNAFDRWVLDRVVPAPDRA